MTKNSFHAELDTYELHLPGRNVVNFGSDEALLNIIDHQYPNWKAAGKVTSIPVGRMPRLFLTDDQMFDTFQKQFRSIQRGECGEVKVYKALLTSSRSLKDGVCILPNIDGNFFQSEEAHVEIDIVVVHPRKGIFVFEIKNATCIKESKIVKGMKRHINFISLLRDYNNMYNIGNLPSRPVPIHGVICSLQGQVDQKQLESFFIFQPEDMASFTTKWLSVLSEVPDVKEDIILKSTEILFARLACLNSMDGAVALLHNDIANNEMQKVYVKPKKSVELVKDQLKNCEDKVLDEENSNDDDVSKVMSEFHLKESSYHGSKRAVIVWTKEQQNIIYNVCKLLLQSRGCRVVIAGPRGSGKTMILVYIANLANHIFNSDVKRMKKDIVICDGRFGSSIILFDKLKEDLKNSGINVLRKLLAPNDLKNKKLILFDETNSHLCDIVTSMKYETNQNVIIFSSRKSIGDDKSFRKFTLTNTLRATKSLVEFVDTYRLSNPAESNFPAVASHNLEGCQPDIRCVEIDVSEDPQQLEYVKEVLSVITENLNRSGGLKDIFVAPFVHPITMEKILSGIEKNDVDYQYFNPADYKSKSKPSEKMHEDIFFRFNDREEAVEEKEESDHVQNYSNDDDFSDQAKIIFCTGNHVDGAEFGTVIILIERSLPPWWDGFFFDSIYIAITRATSNLSVVVNNADRPPTLKHKIVKGMEPELSQFGLLPKRSVENIPAYTFQQCSPDQFSNHIDEIVKNSYWSNCPVLVVGERPVLPNFKKINDPSRAFQFTLSKRRKSKKEKDSTKNETIFLQGPLNKLVISTRIDNIWQHIEWGIDALDSRSRGFSAIVFALRTEKDYSELLAKVDRHRLLYDMYEFQLGSCPFYLLTSFPPIESSQQNVRSVCDHILSQNKMPNKFFPDACHGSSNAKIAIEEKIENVKPICWQEFKQKGNEYYNAGKYEEALSQYMDGVALLEKKYDVDIKTSDVTTMVTLGDELAKLYTNISKVNFEIGMSMEGEFRRAKMEESFTYASKSVEVNPCWDKGYHRKAEALLKLGEDQNAKDMRNEWTQISTYSGIVQSNMKRNVVIKKKMRTFSCWNLVKHKENAYLVDINGEGHFDSLQKALDTLHNIPFISLILNPGEYRINSTVILTLRTVDLVGNVDIPMNKKYGWICDESPVVLSDGQDIHRSLILIHNATLYLSRISLRCQQLRTRTSVLTAQISSRLILRHCSFYALSAAAISCDDKVDLFIDGCRSVDMWGGVLAVNKCLVNVSHSLFKQSKVIALEFRENVSALIEHCTISKCEKQGIACTRGKMEITHCFLEGNGNRHSTNEGSIQLSSTIATISGTQVQNQRSNGIVIEDGEGKFKSVLINRCVSSAFLIQAPCVLSHCKVRDCKVGVTICNHIDGEVRLEDCYIRRSQRHVARFPKAVQPIIERGNVVISKDSQKDTNYMNSTEYKLTRGKQWDKIAEANREVLSNSLNYSHLPTAVGFRSFSPGCAYCAELMHQNPSKRYFLCGGCEMVFYCSLECCTKDKEIHTKYCMADRALLDLYRRSTNAIMKPQHRQKKGSSGVSNPTKKTRLSDTATPSRVNRNKKKKIKETQKKKKKKGW